METATYWAQSCLDNRERQCLLNWIVVHPSCAGDQSRRFIQPAPSDMCSMLPDDLKKEQGMMKEVRRHHMQPRGRKVQGGSSPATCTD